MELIPVSFIANLERRSSYRGATPLRCKNSKNGVWQSYRYTGNVNYRQRPSEHDGPKATFPQGSTQNNFALARTMTCNGAGIVMIVGQGAVQSRAKAVTAYAMGARRMGHLAVCSSWRGLAIDSWCFRRYRKTKEPEGRTVQEHDQQKGGHHMFWASK